MIYTEEQWKIIKQASPHYETARHEYIRNAPRWLTEQVINVYEAATGKTVMHKDLSCAVCVLNIYKQIGKTYFQDKLEREKNINENNAKDNNNSSKVSESDSGDKTKNKRSTKKDSKGTKQNKDN